jgi:hypothetical protein
LLTVLFIFIFSILGMQNFGGSVYFEPQGLGYSPSFDTMWVGLAGR